MGFCSIKYEINPIKKKTLIKNIELFKEWRMLSENKELRIMVK
jgi:hypothetical protein